MKGRFFRAGLVAAILVLAFAVGVAFVSRAGAAPTAGAGVVGTWTVGGGGGSASYLVNTRTGEVWALTGNLKTPVTESKPTSSP